MKDNLKYEEIPSNNDSKNTEDEKDNKVFTKKKTMLIIISFSILLVISGIIITIILLLRDKEKKDIPSHHIYINPASDYKYCIIWLHGLDNKPENFMDLFTKEIKVPFIENTKIILLRAPLMNMTYNHEVLTSWFDIYSFPLDSKDTYSFEDAKNSSDTVLKRIIEEEAELLGGHYEKIYIGGHSQGACVSLYTGYSLKDLLGGVIVCSGILFPQGEIVGDKNKLNVYLGHGDKDQAIPWAFHNETIKRIEDYEGVRKYYYMGHGHSISDEEKEDIGKFLKEIMK